MHYAPAAQPSKWGIRLWVAAILFLIAVVAWTTTQTPADPPAHCFQIETSQDADCTP